MSFVEHIIEPRRLLLGWQAPEGNLRTRYIVAELIREKAENETLLRYLSESSDFQDARKLGFCGHPAFVKMDSEYSQGVVDAFMRRLPPRSRADFPRYLALLRIPSGAVISNFALLGYSGANLPSDGFSIIHPFDEVAEQPCEFLMEIAGFRYTGISFDEIELGVPVEFEQEPENKFDPNAIKIVFDRKKIGYVNRGQLNAFHRWLKNGRVSAVLERKNGTPGRLLIYLFVRVTAVST